jgi:hypothetical protein
MKKIWQGDKHEMSEIRSEQRDRKNLTKRSWLGKDRQM